MKRRLAMHAVDLRVGIPIVERASGIGVGPFPSEDVSEVARAGNAMADAMLATAHGEHVPTAAMPDLSDVNSWRRMANQFAKLVASEDREWWENYVTSLDSDGRRLAHSMLTAR